MKKPENWDDVQENIKSNFIDKEPPAGGTVFQILAASVSIERSIEILKVKFDIAEGDFRNYYSKRFNLTGEDFLIKIRFSNENISRLKGFITCVTDANKNFIWNWNEKELLFKKVAGNLRYKEYQLLNKKIIIIPYIVNFCRLNDVTNMKALPIKKLIVIK